MSNSNREHEYESSDEEGASNEEGGQKSMFQHTALPRPRRNNREITANEIRELRRRTGGHEYLPHIYGGRPSIEDLLTHTGRMIEKKRFNPNTAYAKEIKKRYKRVESTGAETIYARNVDPHHEILIRVPHGRTFEDELVRLRGVVPPKTMKRGHIRVKYIGREGEFIVPETSDLQLYRMGIERVLPLAYPLPRLPSYITKTQNPEFKERVYKQAVEQVRHADVPSIVKQKAIPQVKAIFNDFLTKNAENLYIRSMSKRMTREAINKLFKEAPKNIAREAVIRVVENPNQTRHREAFASVIAQIKEGKRLKTNVFKRIPSTRRSYSRKPLAKIKPFKLPDTSHPSYRRYMTSKKRHMLFKGLIKYEKKKEEPYVLGTIHEHKVVVKFNPKPVHKRIMKNLKRLDRLNTEPKYKLKEAPIILKDIEEDLKEISSANTKLEQFKEYYSTMTDVPTLELMKKRYQKRFERTKNATDRRIAIKIAMRLRELGR